MLGEAGVSQSNLHFLATQYHHHDRHQGGQGLASLSPISHQIQGLGYVSEASWQRLIHPDPCFLGGPRGLPVQCCQPGPAHAVPKAKGVCGVGWGGLWQLPQQGWLCTVMGEAAGQMLHFPLSSGKSSAELAGK